MGALSTPLFGLLVLTVMVALAAAWVIEIRRGDQLRARLLKEAAARLELVNRLAEAQRDRGEEIHNLTLQLEGAQVTAESAGATAVNLAHQLREARAIVPVPVLPRAKATQAERTALLANKCAHCGGAHAIACPRVRRMRFRSDGQSLYEVEFWERWDQSRVVWPEDLFEVEEPNGEASPSLPAPSAAA